jgi:uncharacterized ParB-like nuclease family protein
VLSGCVKHYFLPCPDLTIVQSLEDIQSMPQTLLSQTPLYQHILMSLPSLRGQIKDAVTASTKQWLLEIRNLTGEVGRLALEAMENRTRRWRSRKEKDSMFRLSRVGSAVETVSYETTDGSSHLSSFIRAHGLHPQVDLVLETLKVDFKPLYQSIHIYTALDSLDELRKSYHADRKVRSSQRISIFLTHFLKGAIRPHSPCSSSTIVSGPSN